MSDASPTLLLRGVASFSGERRDLALTGERIGDAPAPGARAVDAEGLTAVPGFVDLQVNGAAGRDITSDPDAIWAVGEHLTRYGVTAFLPTIVTSPPDAIRAAQRALEDGPPAGYAGATVLGLHVEGPFLNRERRGVHDPTLLRAPDRTLAAEWRRDTGVRIVTLAPELPGALEVVADLVAKGVVVSAGHSDASYDQAVAGFDAGIRFVTHLFNGMARLHHRAPGLVGAALSDERVTIGIIPDGVHVDLAVVDLVWRLVGPARFAAVTDAVAALGDAEGGFRLGGAAAARTGDAATFEGRLAGGVVPLDAILRNLVEHCGIPAADAVRALTDTPRHLLGLDDVDDGVTLAPGTRADLTLLTEDLHVAATIVRGRIAWHDGDAARWG
jgi:N-acetylglucosamine-6-phosphate deacetylase